MSDDLSLRGAVAVITGASRGIGREAAHALGRRGASVVLVARSTGSEPHKQLPGTLDEVEAGLRSEGIEARSVQADLTDADDVQRIVDRTLEWFGRCDVLVNNAGYTSNGPILEIPARRWQHAFRVAVITPMQLCQGFVPGMLERGAGRVVSVSSGASQSLMPNLGMYGVSKLAMERWNQYMEAELGGRGVSFNTLRVDRLVPTEGFQSVLERRGEAMATGGNGLQEDHMLSPEKAGEVIAWMAAQPASWSGNVVGFDDIEALGGIP
jgi:NAD(P)-dependent dehydrogenase (short-subunit alcohol dehydrogenase family)